MKISYNEFDFYRRTGMTKKLNKEEDFRSFNIIYLELLSQNHFIEYHFSIDFKAYSDYKVDTDSHLDNKKYLLP